MKKSPKIAVFMHNDGNLEAYSFTNEKLMIEAMNRIRTRSKIIPLYKWN